MKITRIEAWPVTLPLAESYTIAYETVEEAANIFIRVETGTGINGYGCAAPSERVTGERAEDLLRAVDATILPVIKGADPLRIAAGSSAGGFRARETGRHY